MEILSDFIGAVNLENDELMDKLIDYHKNGIHIPQTPFPYRNKKSMDVILDPKDKLYYEYMDEVQKKLIIPYANFYPRVNENDAWTTTENVAIQYYNGNDEGFFNWHCERTGTAFANRYMVWITYLNDVEEGGETEFYHQKLKVKPEKGLSILFPVDWMFTHRGNPTNEKKGIVTSWLNYYK
jgi:hypothetical protein